MMDYCLEIMTVQSLLSMRDSMMTSMKDDRRTLEISDGFIACCIECTNDGLKLGLVEVSFDGNIIGLELGIILGK